MNTDDRKFLARTALILFIGGLTIPFIIATFATENIAIGFGLISVVLALIMGIFSWRHIFGKITSIGVCILISSLGVLSIVYIKKRAKEHAEMQSAYETYRTETEPDNNMQPVTRVQRDVDDE